jgi:hypothetical protein
MVDFDAYARTQRVEVIDNTTGAVLDRRDVAGFRNGVYLVWDISGDVQIRVIHTGGINAVISGLFFGNAGTAPPPPPPAGTARFLQSDTATRGSWRGVYGGEGHSIALDTQSVPSWASVSVGSGWQQWTWAASTTDTTALQRATGTGRLATCWYGSNGSFNIRVTDGGTHRIAVYMVDFDAYARTQRVEVIDNTTGAVLDRHDVSGFRNGVYLVWDISGDVQIRVIHTGGINAVISGLFFGNAGTAPPPPPAGGTASFLQSDTTTGGSWRGVYGGEGHSIALDTQSYPAWASVSVGSGWQQWTWAASTVDTTALQRATGTGRLATCWYGSTGSFNIRVTDGATHRIAVYMVDFDAYARTQRVEVIDNTTGAVLDRRDVAGFRNGVYLVWDISGDVQIRVIHTGGINAVISGLFFGRP